MFEYDNSREDEQSHKSFSTELVHETLQPAVPGQSGSAKAADSLPSMTISENPPQKSEQTLPGQIALNGQTMRTDTLIRLLQMMPGLPRTGLRESIGGLPLAWDERVAARLETNGSRYSLTGIEGVRINLPLPNDIASALGLRNPLQIGIREIALSEPDAQGNRSATLRCNGALESVSMRINAAGQPITDRNGNLSVSAVLNQGGRVPLELSFNPQQLAAGDLNRIDFRLNVRENQRLVAAAVEGLFGCRLDNALRGVLNGIESIERSGDTITIRRREASSHSLGGLTVETGRDVSFRCRAGQNGAVEVSNISGINITHLPATAEQIYRTRLPIAIQSVALSAPNRDGERNLSVTGSRGIRQVDVRLDRQMTPQSISLEVLNPVQAWADTFNGRYAPAVVQATTDRIRATNNYTIRISANGDVDYGGLQNVHSMLANAGDLHSFTGLVSTAGAAILPGPQSQTAVGNAAIRTFNQIRRDPLSVFSPFGR